MAGKDTKSEIGFREDNGLLARGPAHPARRGRRLVGRVSTAIILASGARCGNRKTWLRGPDGGIARRQADGTGLHTRRTHAHPHERWQGASVHELAAAADPGA